MLVNADLHIDKHKHSAPVSGKSLTSNNQSRCTFEFHRRFAASLQWETVAIQQLSAIRASADTEQIVGLIV